MKARITVIVTREFDLKPEYYTEGTTPEHMLSDEINYADEMFHEWISNDGVQFETKGELIKEAE